MKYSPNLSNHFFNTEGLSFDLRHFSNWQDHNDPNIETSHIHGYCEIYLNISGNVSFLVENHLYPISRGDIIITKPNEFHHCIFNEDSFQEHYCLWFSEDGWMEILQSFFSRKTGEGNLITFSDKDKNTIIYLFSELEKAINENQSLRKASLFLRILEYINRGTAVDEAETNELPDELGKILKYINAEFYKSETVEDICKNFFISRTTLERSFKKHLNITPKQYITAKRLTYARTLLSEGVGVQEACDRSGFPDCSHFIVFFKNRFKITPLQYKKQCAERKAYFTDDKEQI